MKLKGSYLIALTALLYCCGGRSASGGGQAGLPGVKEPEIFEPAEVQIVTPTENKLRDIGLINIKEVDPGIEVFLVYATEANFTGEVLYEDIYEAYMLPEMAESLSRVQKRLSAERPGYGLMIYDAARPMSVQRKMRKIAVAAGKGYYVADPGKGGGLHNFGAAVDLTIIDPNGNPVPMGTEFDFFGPQANIDREESLLNSGKISREEYDNRRYLRSLMKAEGFRTVTSEWWHFNFCSREEAKAKYQLIDF